MGLFSKFTKNQAQTAKESRPKDIIATSILPKHGQVTWKIRNWTDLEKTGTREIRSPIYRPYICTGRPPFYEKKIIHKLVCSKAVLLTSQLILFDFQAQDHLQSSIQYHWRINRGHEYQTSNDFVVQKRRNWMALDPCEWTDVNEICLLSKQPVLKVTNDLRALMEFKSLLKMNPELRNLYFTRMELQGISEFAMLRMSLFKWKDCFQKISKSLCSSKSFIFQKNLSNDFFRSEIKLQISFFVSFWELSNVRLGELQFWSTKTQSKV